MSKELKIEEIDKIFKNQTNIYLNFAKIFTRLKEAEEKASKIRKEYFQYFEDMTKIKEQDSKTLEGLYKNFGKVMKDLEKEREEHLKKIKDLLIPVAEYYPTLIKQTKNELEKIPKAKKNTEDLRKSKASKEQLRRSEREETNVAESFEDKYLEYENDRIKNSKFIILNYIHSELKYHCNTLQKLSTLFSTINESNILIELEEFAKNYGIQKFNFESLGLDMKKIKNSVIKKDDEEKQKINEVYPESVNNEDSEKNDEFDGSFNKIKKKSKITKNSKLGKSQASDIEDNQNSRNIENDVE